jgi:phage host-nuclease inhibitor protein Gam
MTSRAKKILTDKPLPIADRAELETVAGEIAHAVAHRAVLTDKLNAEIVAMRARYEAKIMALTERIDAETDRCHEYVVAHDDIIPPNKRSVELLHAVIGFRTGMPRVKPLKGWTLKSVLEACLTRKPSWVRQTPELDRERIIAEVPVGGAVESVGVSVAQDETFFVAPKLEEPETAPKTEAAK